MTTPRPADAVRQPLVLTWHFIETYRRRVDVEAAAAGTGHAATALVVHPGMLLGAAGDRLADLRTDLHGQDHTVGVLEVEVIVAAHGQSPNLELVEAAATAWRRETEDGQHRATGEALRALLAWLHREERIFG